MNHKTILNLYLALFAFLIGVNHCLGQIDMEQLKRYRSTILNRQELAKVKGEPTIAYSGNSLPGDIWLKNDGKHLLLSGPYMGISSSTIIPPGINNLKNLNTASFTSLQILDFPTDLSGLINLTEFSYSELKGEPIIRRFPNFETLPSLEIFEIEIRDNDFKITEVKNFNTIFKIENLKALKLRCKNLNASDIQEISNLKKLIYLDLSGSQVSDLSILNNPELLFARISYNQISNIPVEFFRRHPKLHSLELRGNKTLQVLEEELSLLKSLSSLDLAATNITSLPKSIERIPLKRLILYATPINFVPASIKNHPTLEYLEIGSPGSFEWEHEDFISMKNLKTLFIRYNRKTRGKRDKFAKKLSKIRPDIEIK